MMHGQKNIELVKFLS